VVGCVALRDRWWSEEKTAKKNKGEGTHLLVIGGVMSNREPAERDGRGTYDICVS
jgi:hypothetical protein